MVVDRRFQLRPIGSVTEYVARCELLEGVPATGTVVRLGRGEVTLERLSAVGAAPFSTGSSTHSTTGAVASGDNGDEADWEQVIIHLAERPDGSSQPAWVVISAHDETGDDLRRGWDDPDMTSIGDHPVVYAGLGSHSGTYLVGEYPTTFEAPAFRGLLRRFRAISQVLLPWTRDQEQGEVGIPYVDHSRGDGSSIGPDQHRKRDQR